MEWSWQEGHLETGCSWAEGENGEITMRDRKQSMNHLLESLPDPLGIWGWGLMLRNGVRLEWR